MLMYPMHYNCYASMLIFPLNDIFHTVFYAHIV